MIINLVQFGAEEVEKTGLAVLGLDPKAFVLQLATWLVFFFLMKKFAFGPIVVMLEKRRQVIDDGVRLGREMETEKAKFDEQSQAKLKAARRDADKIIADAEEAARKSLAEVEVHANKKAEKIVSDARAQMAEEAKKLRSEMRNELAGLVTDATEKIIGVKIDATKDAELIKSSIGGVNAPAAATK